MNTTTTVVLITLTGLNLVVTGTALALAWVTKKKMEKEIQEAKMKTNKTVDNLKSALQNLEF